LTKAVKTIIAEDSGASLRKRIVELETPNSRLKTTTVESAETIAMLQCAVDAGIEDYNLLLDGNKSLLVERDDFCYCCEDLGIELARVHSDAEKSAADLDSRIRSAGAHSIDVAAAGEKRLRDFEGELV
jgi:hypothetical protein